jgi:hypothetical protein
LNFASGIEFAKVIVRQSPTFARSTSGQGALVGLQTIGDRVYVTPEGKDQPIRNCGAQTVEHDRLRNSHMSALIVRLH